MLDRKYVMYFVLICLAISLSEQAIAANCSHHRLVNKVEKKVGRILVSGNKMGVSDKKFDSFGIYDLVGKDQVIYDVGCGAGYFTKKVVKRAKRVIAIDPDDKGLSELGKRLSGAKKLRVIKGSFPEAIRRRDFGKVDFIHAAFVLHLVPKEKLPGIFLGFAKLLKEDGLVYIFVPDIFDNLLENFSAIKSSYEFDGKAITFDRLFNLLEYVESQEQVTSISTSCLFEEKTPRLMRALAAVRARGRCPEESVNYYEDNRNFLPEEVNALSLANVQKLAQEAGLKLVEHKYLEDYRNTQMFVLRRR